MSVKSSIELRGRRRAGFGLGVAMTAMAVVHSAPALAQSADPIESAQDRVAEDQEILVTGTRVVRENYESTQPLTVLSESEIENQSPTNNIADFVNQLPSMAGSLRPANSRLAISSGLAGINALNLRNLGEIRTLVLLDGRRSVGSSVTGLVDINTFPQSLISRVEVVTGGASAAYGSDAVAGVVNFVLDKRFEGLKLSADSGITTYGDGFNYSFDAAYGQSFAGGRGHLLLDAEYAHRDGIFYLDREWNAHGARVIANPDYSTTNGAPRYIVRGPGGTNIVAPGGIIRSVTRINSGSTSGADLAGLYFGQGGAINRYDYGTINSSSTSIGGDWLVADNGRNIGLDADDDRRGVFGRLSFDVAPWATLYAEASYNWQKSLFNAGPQYASSRTISGSNPYLINLFGEAALSNVRSISLGTTSVDLPYRKTNNQRDVQRYTVGGEGEFTAFGKNAFWSAYAQYGEMNSREQLRDVMNNEAIALATDAVFAPAGNALGVPAGTIVCRSSLTDPSNGCAPINWLGVGVISPEAVDYVLGDPYRDQTLQQLVAGFNLSTTPFATWGGDVSVAVGGEYRREEVSGSVPTEFQSGWSVGNYLPTFGSYDVKEAYLETIVPLGVGLELNGAVRATDYSTSGYVTTWKAGATWQPIPDIRFRATQSRDIRAPNLNELYQAGTSRTNSFTYQSDQDLNGDGVLDSATISYLETTTGNTNLRPETADSTTAGVVLQPRFVPGFSFSADWFQIKLKDAIGQFYAPTIYDLCQEGFNDFCSGFRPDPTGTRDYLFSASPFNFSRITTRGIDFDATYQVPLDRLFGGTEGSFTLRGLATHYLENVVNDGITTPIDTVGSNGGYGPADWIFRFSATYDTPTFSVSGVARGISSGTYSNSYVECESSCPVVDPVFSTIDNNHVSGTFYVDANLTAKIGETMLGDAQLYLNVSNLFDREPLLVPESGMAANTTYSDLLGRSFRVGVRFRMR